MIRVVVLAHSLAMRAGLRTLLSEDNDIVVVSDLATLEDIDPAALTAAKPDDIDIIVAESIAFDAELLADYLEGNKASPAVLLLTDEPLAPQYFSRLPLRAWGLLPYDASEEELLATVQALNLGLFVGEPALVQPLLGPAIENPLSITANHEELTDREAEVLQLLAQGLANKQIALQLEISSHTVKFHVSSIYSKFDVTNRTEAVTKGVRMGLIVL